MNNPLETLSGYEHTQPVGDELINDILYVYAPCLTDVQHIKLKRLSFPTFTRTIRTTITDSNGGVYSDDERAYISKYEVQERIAELDALKKQGEEL